MTLERPGDLSLGDAIDWLADGRALAYPTETLWGLGCRAKDSDAVCRLQGLKGRDANAPISILVSDFAVLADLGFRTGGVAAALAERFWPGPLTLVLPCAKDRFGSGIARADGAVGVRCSPHPDALALALACEAAGLGPPTATSCNRSGAPGSRNRQQARAFCAASPAAAVLAALRGDTASPSTASTVLDLASATPRVLRWGAISETELNPLLEELAAA